MLEVTCYHPVRAYRSRERNPETGRYLITFNPVKNLIEGNSISLPCGRCVGCRIARSQEWAMRCVHEAQMHEHNCYVTLTYSNEHLPADYSVHVREWQLFMKRLRKHVGGKKIRSFACGEYGDENLRPHYHAIIFNHDFADKVLWKENRNGDRLYISKSLSQVWPYGHATLGDVTFKSAAYVARYIMKKKTGELPDTLHYTRSHPLTGKIVQVQPEFVTQSRRPGLGTTWFQKFKSDAFPSDFLIVDGKRMKPPRFYLDRLPEDDVEEIKRARKREGLKKKEDHTKERLHVRETILKARINRLKRNLKDDEP